MLVNIQRRTQARPLGDQRPSPAGLLKSCRGQSGSLGLHQTRGGFSNIPDQDLCKEHLSCLDTHVDVNVWITHTHTHTHTHASMHTTEPASSTHDTLCTSYSPAPHLLLKLYGAARTGWGRNGPDMPPAGPFRHGPHPEALTRCTAGGGSGG